MKDGGLGSTAGSTASHGLLRNGEAEKKNASPIIQSMTESTSRLALKTFVKRALKLMEGGENE